MTDPLAQPPPVPDGDAEIVRLIKAREGSGLRLLLDRHGGTIRAGLRRKYHGMLNDTEVDEAMNTATFQAWRSIGQFDTGRGSLRAWLYVIARNAANGLLRERRRQGLEPRSDVIERLPVADTEEPAEESTPLLRTVRECVAKLPRVQRTIIEADLHTGDVADAGELAAQLGTSKNSIYVSRTNARKSLRRCIGARGFVPNEKGKKGEET